MLMSASAAAGGYHLDHLIDDNDVDEGAIPNITRPTSYFSFSTNYTESNLPGAGRVLGIVYSLAGRHLERIVGVVAQKVGYRLRSDVFYHKIHMLDG